MLRRHAGRSFFVALALASTAVVAVQAITPIVAEAAPRWFDGSIRYSNIINCASIIQGSPYQEFGAGTYVGFNGDPEASQPSPGNVYYVHVVVAALGNACSGQRTDINFKLPASTSLAISGASPVRCYYDNVGQLSLSECPQALPSSAGAYGAGYFRAPSTDSAHANLWPLPIGRTLEIQIPVISSAAVSGSPLQGAIKMFDGNDNPVLMPDEGVYVFSTAPTIAPSPAGTTFGSTQWPTTVRSETYLYQGSTSGTANFDLMTTSGGPPVQIDGPIPIPLTSGGYIVWDDWQPYTSASMQPNTTYYWRLRYMPTGGPEVFGQIQSFTTPTTTGVSATPPIVSAIGRSSANPTSAATVTWDVRFSKTVTGVDAGDFALVASGVTGASIASVTPSGAAQVFTVTANTGSSNGTLRLNLVGNGTIRDAANVALAGAANGSFTGAAYDVTRLVPPPPAPKFRAIDPARLLESRPGLTTIDGQFNNIGLRDAGSTTELQITGRAGVPPDATAVVLNVTATEAQAAGYITVYPCGTTRPTVSNLNTTPGGTVPNAVITKIGTAGKVCIYTSIPTQLLTDINGYFPAGSSFTAIDPARLLESRPGLTTIDGQFNNIGLRDAGSTTELQITGRAGVPPDATAVVLNVTATEAQAAGYITVYPCGTTRPTVSNLNTTPGGTVPNAVITKIGTAGKVCIYTSIPTQLLTDINGYFPA